MIVVMKMEKTFNMVIATGKLYMQIRLCGKPDDSDETVNTLLSISSNNNNRRKKTVIMMMMMMMMKVKVTEIGRITMLILIT